MDIFSSPNLVCTSAEKPREPNCMCMGEASNSLHKVKTKRTYIRTCMYFTCVLYFGPRLYVLGDTQVTMCEDCQWSLYGLLCVGVIAYCILAPRTLQMWMSVG